MNHLMTGALAMGFAVAALFFFRFWRETRDRLFAFFALSLMVLSVNRFALALASERDISDNYFYWIRFAAFAIILYAILDKNWQRSENLPDTNTNP